MTMSRKTLTLLVVACITLFVVLHFGINFLTNGNEHGQAAANVVAKAEVGLGAFAPWVKAAVLIVLIHFVLLFFRWLVNAWEPGSALGKATKSALLFYNRSYVNLALIILAILFFYNKGIVVYDKSPEWIKTITKYAFWVFLAFYVFKCFKRINEDEMGIRSTLGIPGTTLDQGLHFALWLVQKITIFPRSIQSIRFAVESVPTKRGKVDGYPDVIEGTEIHMLFVLYYYFSKDNLKKTVTLAPGPSEAEMAGELVPFTQDILRNLLGRMPWRLANEERFKLTQLALSRMVPREDRAANKCFFLYKEKENDDDAYRYSFIHLPENLENLDGEQRAEAKKHLPPPLAMLEVSSPFVQFGLDARPVMLAIENLEFVQSEMTAAISAPEIARLQKEATIRTAEGSKEKLRLEGEGAAEARKAMIEVIKSDTELEVLYSFRELAQGTSNTILYQLPGAVADRVSNMLGGNSFGDLFRMFGPEDQKYFRDLIEEGIRKLSEKK